MMTMRIIHSSCFSLKTGYAYRTQELSVMVKGLWSLEDVDIAPHMQGQVADPDNTGNGHDHFLADGRMRQGQVRTLGTPYLVRVDRESRAMKWK